jgi:tRNA (guanine26-N2/guanine27-N2)-dimethyltransferase
MMRLVAKPHLTDKNYGFLAYCHSCGNYRTVTWRKLGKISCACNHPALTVSGAMWLGKLHHRQQLERFKILAQQLEWQEVTELLSLMAAEIDFPPYFYTLREIGSRGKLDLPKRSHLIQALQDQGYQATATHINPQAIKTNVDLDTCIAIAKDLGQVKGCLKNQK